MLINHAQISGLLPELWEELSHVDSLLRGSQKESNLLSNSSEVPIRFDNFLNSVQNASIGVERISQGQADLVSSWDLGLKLFTVCEGAAHPALAPSRTKELAPRSNWTSGFARA